MKNLKEIREWAIEFALNWDGGGRGYRLYTEDIEEKTAEHFNIDGCPDWLVEIAKDAIYEHEKLIEGIDDYNGSHSPNLTTDPRAVICDCGAVLYPEQICSCKMKD